MAGELNTQREIDAQALREIEAQCLLENARTAELHERAALRKADAAQADPDENDTGEAQ